MPEILTDEQAAAIWSGQTSSILGLETTKTPEELAAEKTKVDEAAKAAEAAKTVTTTTTDTTTTDTKKVVKDSDLDNVFTDKQDDKTDDTDDDSTTTLTDTSKKGGGGGRKTDLIQTVSKLIEEGVLFGYDDGSEVKTVDEATQLIKDNFSNRDEADKEAWKKEYKESLSPQVQAMLHYAEQGAQSATQIADLLGAIKEVEEVAELDPKTPAGQEQIVRQTLKSKGFKDTYIDKQVNILKDLGGTKLQEEADELYPELAEMKSAQVKQRIVDQEERRKSAEAASKVYVSTVKSTLDKETVGGIKLSREEKAKLYEAVTQPKYVSLNGAATNLFVKTLEDLQFGEKANYEQFMNIVNYVIDPKGFTEKLKTAVTNDVTDATFRKLKTSKTTTANTDTSDTGTRTSSTSSGKKTISKSGFVNPYA